ncbi:alkylation response protein AidB-like acyl-CoA dehydrogenase [Amycolatopsis echigonensis]|uniref:Alkylation response protein AidB-like acyl-CoA dehydrogenase n=1 Tax=Amycolatopsis echigonensis TaxID=2576905 RepID=A0A2N3W9V7_9PSEU|nr:acyl-CoA dehydrogenase family protein [Amycolatopsis niigatensis]PKV90657.1 alkylation response protein AidB-like acyl-CoA dehydrogenase [Amycolatopsis niigatensis]
MDFSLTEAQNDLSALARRILADQVTAESLGPHGSGGFDAPLWTVLARSGVLDAALPATVGGGGFGLLEQCSVLIEIGRAVAPVPYLSSVVQAGSVLTDPLLAERWLLPVSRGKAVLAVALGGFFVASDGRLTGTQTAVPFAAYADALLVEANDGVYIVEKDAVGVSIEAQSTTDHADAGLVTLSNTPGVALGDVGEQLRLRGTLGACAQQLGVLERALELTAAYTRERKQFDKVLGSFQAVRHRLADAYIDVEAVRLTLWQAAWKLSEGLDAAADVATAKFWAAEAGHRVAHTAVHLHGGVGIDVEHPVHRYFAAAKRLEFTSGGATEQLLGLGELVVSPTA